MNKKLWLAAPLMLLLPFQAVAGWVLDNDSSDIYAVSIKSNSTGENHSFSLMKGEVSDSGNAHLEIDLSSVDSGIEIRDERMRNMLFETTSFLHANIDVKVDLAEYTKLKPGNIKRETLSFYLDLRNRKHNLKAPVTIMALGNNSFMINSSKPLILNARDFDLESGISSLQAIAGLPSIATAVPVTFSLVFKPE